MSNDDRLVPRDYPIPVSVRRPLPAGVDPSLAPPASPQAAPPAAPAPHVIYINNNIPAPVTAGPAAVYTAPPAAPPVVHHHHYTTNETTQRISYRIPAPRSNSALGMASLALGIIACVVCWVPWLGLMAVPIGVIGAVLGVLGTLVSVLFRRSSPGLPITGVFICCLAAGISIASTSSLPYWRKQLDKAITAIVPPSTAQPHSLASPTPLPPLPTTPGSNLFDSSPTPSPFTPSVSPVPQIAPPPAATPHATAGKPAISSKVDPAIANAMGTLASAEKACDQRTMQTPEYQSAVKAAADARAREQQLRQTARVGSPELQQASQDMIAADNALTDMLTRAKSNDPQVAAARQTLAATRSAINH